MQRCPSCGQVNDDLDDHCIYCGEELYIELNNKATGKKMDHLYADSIAKELIDSNTVFEDDIDEITRELLGEKEKKEKNPFLDDEMLFEEEKREDNTELFKIETELKKKIRRNKKLETNMGLLIRNIEAILDDINGPLLIFGEISTNDKLENKSVELSAISYDANKKPLTKMDTMINVDHGNFKSFNISLNLDIKKTEIIILLPEMIQYDDEEFTETTENSDDEDEYEYYVNENQIFIEQLRDIERKIGLELTNTSVLIKSDNSLEIVGEIKIKNPDKYNSIKIAATCYDEENHILATESKTINTKLFLGFDTLKIKVSNVEVKKIQRIKLYPTFQ